MSIDKDGFEYISVGFKLLATDWLLVQQCTNLAVDKNLRVPHPLQTSYLTFDDYKGLAGSWDSNYIFIWYLH